MDMKNENTSKTEVELITAYVQMIKKAMKDLEIKQSVLYSISFFMQKSCQQKVAGGTMEKEII